jgi:hypothetical protein
MWLKLLFSHKQEQLECLSKIRCNKTKKNICVNFLMLAGPFKQTGSAVGRQAAVSHLS